MTASHIHAFMAAYRRVREGRDTAGFAALFTPDGAYHNTPFQDQRGNAALAGRWARIELQRDIALRYDVLAETPAGGIAHWHVTYQVASEELFRLWSFSAGTGLPERKPGAPLPRLVLDGVPAAEFVSDVLCRKARIWWHSVPVPGQASRR